MTIYHPKIMNLEITTVCPLHCPQCYCDPTSGRELSLGNAVYWLKQGANNGVKHVMLSGGETMCYTHLYEVIAETRRLGMDPNIAISGWGFREETFHRLVESGMGSIYVSINGPTEEINSKSRDGFHLACNALEILKRNAWPHTAINWVMHISNADSFPDMLEFAENFGVEELVVMAFKPDGSHSLPSLPTEDQMFRVARLVKKYNGTLRLCVENCFSPMCALLGRRFWGNTNRGYDKGCTAGLDSFSVNVDGMLSPCRHLDYFEKWDTLAEYWENSPALKKIRHVAETPCEPCLSCALGPYCRHCLAINSKLNQDIYIGNETCPLEKAFRKEVNA